MSDIVKESSAARNGMLTEHAVLEIDGQNVVGMKDKDIAKVIDDAPVTVTVTIMPGNRLYEVLILKETRKELLVSPTPLFPVSL